MNSGNKLSAQTWVVISLIGFILFLGAVLALLLLSDRIGNIKPQIYFFLVVILGLVCAAFLSGAMRSMAKYNGTINNGTLQLGGPIVVLVILVLLGYRFMPSREIFPIKFTVFSKDPKEDLVRNGVLKLFLSKPDSQRIENGYCVFADVDTKYQGKKANVLAIAPGFYNLSQTITIPTGDSSISLYMLPRPDSVFVRGSVLNKNGQAVVEALINFENGIGRHFSDSLGNFQLMLPCKDGQEINIKVYHKGKLRYNSTQIVSPNIGLVLQLN